MNKLAWSRDVMKRAHEIGDSIIVFTSGGKDGRVVLDLAVSEFGKEKVIAVFMYLVKGLRCADRPAEQAARVAGVKLLSYPHWNSASIFKSATFMPPRRGIGEMRLMRITDIEMTARRETGYRLIAYGHRSDESLERRAMLNKLNGLDEKTGRVYPLAKWNSKDVFAYLRFKRIPLPPTFGKNGVSGVDLRLNTLKYLREFYPGDYAKLIARFPYAEAQIKREEFYPDVETET